MMAVLAFASGTPAAARAAVVVGLCGLVVRVLGRIPTRSPLGGRGSDSDSLLPSSGPSWTRWPGRRRWSERRARAARRLAWPSVADEIGSALRSGASLRQALGEVATRGGAAAPRLAELVHPVSRGDDVPAAARRWADRSEDAGERLLAGAVELAAGATRAEPVLFDTVARTLRERAALAGEMRVQTAQARASAAALSALPLAFTGLCALADRSVLSFLAGTLPGLACLVLGVGLQGLGLWWMRRTIAGVAP